VLACLEQGSGEVGVAEPVRTRALGCIQRMLDFVAANPAAIARPSSGFVAGLGAT
jgi:quinolinate synthase